MWVRPGNAEMRIEWDREKSGRNLAKHGISFETAELVFYDRLAMSQVDRVENAEERWQTVGRARGIAVLLVAHTRCDEEGEEVIRIISARRATRHERRAYEEDI